MKHPLTISPHNRESAKSQIDKLDPTRLWVMTITEKKSKRSLEQNSWMRGFAKDCGAHFGYDPDTFYDMLMLKFCPEYIVDLDTGEEIKKPGHFSKKQDGTPRSTAEAAEIQDAVQRWAAEYGFVWEEAA
jgi:hypothetical protein